MKGRARMSKELSPLGALNRICEHLDLDDEYFYSKNGEKADYKIIETALKRNKALEIIKEHKLLNYVLKNEKCANMYHLSKDKIDLLKEVLS